MSQAMSDNFREALKLAAICTVAKQDIGEAIKRLGEREVSYNEALMKLTEKERSLLRKLMSEGK